MTVRARNIEVGLGYEEETLDEEETFGQGFGGVGRPAPNLDLGCTNVDARHDRSLEFRLPPVFWAFTTGGSLDSSQE